MIADSQLLVAGRYSSELLEAVEQPLHLVPFAVGDPIEPWVDRVGRTVGNHVADAAPLQILPHGPAAVAFVSRQSVGSQPGPTTPRTLDCARFQQQRQRQLLMALPAGQREDDGLATALGAEMDLGAESAATPAERLWAPFFRAPAACWWARMTDPSTKWSVQSSAPRASASAWSAWRMRDQTPVSCQRRKRLYTVCQLPYDSGRSRHGAPVLDTQSKALSICRWSRFGRPLQGLVGGSSGANRAHCSSVSSWRCIYPL
jgi:hypothetical protein